jgi:penicillin-binding protein 2
MALAALETGKRTPQQTISDPGYFMFGGHRFRDDKEGGHGAVDMYRSIVQSCDTYYYLLANDLGVDTMHTQMAPLGFGQLTGIDILGEARGILPSTDWKRRTYRRAEQQRWYAGETISLGIGQGYNSFTMLQLAHATATLANDGLKMKPHLVREVIDVVTRERQPIAKQPIGQLPAKAENIAVVKRALVGVNIEGTSALAFRGALYASAGKTGTAQVIQIKQNEKYDASKVDERHRDHALYMAFAPADEPQIALAMVVENAGFGAQNAAPIARRIFDYWLQGLYPTVADTAAVQKGLAPAPAGQQRLVKDLPWPPDDKAAAAIAPAASRPASAAASEQMRRSPSSGSAPTPRP